MYVIKEYLQGEFLLAYKCNSLEEVKRKLRYLKMHSLFLFSWKIFKDNEEIEIKDLFPENIIGKLE